MDADIAGLREFTDKVDFAELTNPGLDRAYAEFIEVYLVDTDIAPDWKRPYRAAWIDHFTEHGQEAKQEPGFLYSARIRWPCVSAKRPGRL